MPSIQSKEAAALLEKLQTRSVFYGDFVLSSGAKSRSYVDCKLTTLDAEGACLVGRAMYAMIRQKLTELGRSATAVGGLTMGADPIALAIGMTSWMQSPETPLQVFAVRKSPKSHGQNKLVEGNFTAGESVIIIDDVVTKGDSTLKAIEAIEQAGGKVALVAVLVDREEGGCKKIRDLGYTVTALYQRGEVIDDARGAAPAAAVVA